MVPQTHKGTALGPMGNLQGSMRFYCLNTGHMLKQCSFMPLPMPDRIIKPINRLGLKWNRDTVSSSLTEGRNLTNGWMRYPKMTKSSKVYSSRGR
jgi:hypothetical protein